MSTIPLIISDCVGTGHARPDNIPTFSNIIWNIHNAPDTTAIYVT
jgi:hypothetical protein